MENRHGLAVGGGISQATGTAERQTALELIDGRRSQKTPDHARRGQGL